MRFTGVWKKNEHEYIEIISDKQHRTDIYIWKIIQKK